MKESMYEIVCEKAGREGRVRERVLGERKSVIELGV